MKKQILFGMLAAATMLFTTSCEKEIAPATAPAGESAVVTINVGTPEIGSKAYSDGLTATNLQYAVYDKDGNILPDLTKTDATINGSAIVPLKLTTGNTYSVLFWADADDAPYTVDLTNKTLSVDYSDVDSNDEALDAFYKYETFTVKGNMSVDIKLKRPFAQLNIGTNDYEESAAAGYEPTESSVTVKNIYNAMNLETGDVTGNAAAVSFKSAAIPTSEDFPVADYDYMVMNYLLVSADEETIEVEFTYTDGTTANTRTVGMVPVQRNHRTNLFGQLLTSDVDINVEIEPDYDDDDINYPSTQLQALLLAAAVGGEVTLEEDVKLPKSLVVNKAMVINLNGHDIIVDNNSGELEEGDAIVAKADLVINGEGTVEGNTRAIWARGDYGATVIINGGNFVGGKVNSEVIYTSGDGVIKIYGGTFEAKVKSSSMGGDEYAILNVHDSNCEAEQIQVYGGTFKEFNPADNTSEGAGTSFVPAGYKAVADGNNFVVVKDEVDAVVGTDADFENAMEADEPQSVIYLTSDVTIDVTAWATIAFGGPSTESITIEGNGHTITFNQLNSDWNNITTENNAKLIINNAHITNSGYNDGPWNRHDLNFACDVELNDVTTDKAIALKADGTLKNVTISDANTSDTYAIWIQPNGQTVSVDGCLIDMLDCSDGRGIKIDEQYVTPQKVTLNVSNTEFKTEEKAAIIVKSQAGADITLSNVDITAVAADNVNEVWVDEASKAYFHLVNVVGGKKTQEGLLHSASNPAADAAAVKAAIDANEPIIYLADGTFEVDIYNLAQKGSLTLVGNGSTKVAFNNLQVRASQFKEFKVSNCVIERMPNKSWGHLVFGSSDEADGVYTIENCTFNGVGSQGIFINENTSGVIYNIIGCTFNGDFGGEGAITVQNNDGVNHTINVKDCTFNSIPATSHEIFIHYAYKGWTLNTDLTSDKIHWNN
ncbi:MAG: hypothetical protein J6K90_07060 [Tidjanibacter sp.]|nr:hypothetical protein [Tidjanibacter sp.]